MLKKSIIARCILIFSLHVSVAAQADIAVESVKFQSVDRLRHFHGLIEAVNQSTISAQTSGQITQINFDVDDYVNKGDVILQLADKEQKSRLNKAQSSVKEARAVLEQAEKEYTRVKNIYAKKLVAKSTLEKARSAYKAAEARLGVARAQLAEATEQWQYTAVRAPYSGIVVKRFVEKGELVRPGKALMTGLSLDHLRVTLDIPQDLVGLLRRQPVIFVLLPNGKRLDIASNDVTIFPYADKLMHTFRVRLQLPVRAGEWYPGMTVKIGMVVGQAQQLTVPVAALVTRSEVNGVYVLVDKDIVLFRQVRLGSKQLDRVTVLSGLQEGDKVILDPLKAVTLLKSQRLE